MVESELTKAAGDAAQVESKPWWAVSRATMATGLAGIVATAIIGAAQHYNIPILVWLSFITGTDNPQVDTGILITLISTAFTNYTPPSVQDVARRLNAGVVAFALHSDSSPLKGQSVGDKMVVPVDPPGKPPVVPDIKTSAE